MFIGVVGFIVRDKSVPYFEIGYWLQTSKTGFGYITEAVGLVEQYAFHDLLALRLEIRMAASNLKSQGVAKRCGYEAEATLINSRRLPSGEIDSTMIYAKTRCNKPFDQSKQTANTWYFKFQICSELTLNFKTRRYIVF